MKKLGLGSGLFSDSLPLSLSSWGLAQGRGSFFSPSLCLFLGELAREVGERGGEK